MHKHYQCNLVAMQLSQLNYNHHSTTSISRQDGRVRQQPESIYQGHPFYPQLNRVASPGGSEIYRVGGFRSPLRSTLEGSFVLEGSSGVLGSIRRPKSAGMHMVDSVLSLSAPLKQMVEAVLPTTTSSSSIIHSLSESDTRNKILSDELDELGGGSSAILDDDRDREDSRCLFIGESVTAETVTAEEEEEGGYVSHKYHHRPTSRGGDYVGVKIVPQQQQKQQPKRVLAHMDDTSVTSKE